MTGVILRLSDRKNKMQQNGFALVEIIVSFALILIVLIAFLTMFNQSNRANVFARSNTKAVYMAQSYMENMFMESSKNSYATTCINLTDGSTYGFSRIGTSEEFEKIENGYYIKIKFTLKSGNLYRVLVQIYDNTNLALMAQNEDAFSFQE